MADKTANAQTQKKWTAWLTQTFYWKISLDREVRVMCFPVWEVLLYLILIKILFILFGSYQGGMGGIMNRIN